MKTIHAHMDEDILYIRQFCNGDIAGFEMLVRRYQDRVLNIVHSLIGNDRESDDIAQEVFLKVYHHLRSFKGDARFSTWLYRIVVNTVYSFMRTRTEIASDTSILEQRSTAGNDPAAALLAKERNRLLHAAIQRIPLPFRTALVLKDIEGLSYGDIAAVLQCRIGTVESRIYRARQYLKEELQRIEGGLP